MAATDMTLAEGYAALTGRCGLVDRSERGKLALTGAGAVEFLGGQVTNELVGVNPGEGRYAAFLTHKGKMLGDLRILVASGIGAPMMSEMPSSGPTGGVVELLLDTERSTLQALFDMIRRFKVGYEVELHKRTLERSLLSLIGPKSGEVLLNAFAPFPISQSQSHLPAGSGGTTNAAVVLPEDEHRHVSVCLDQTPVRIIRTDLGYDALFDSSALDEVRRALLDAGATGTSEAAAEIVRVEHGRPRYGIDIDDSTIPQEAGLNERAVSFTKGCYVGQETVARLYYKGKPNRHLRGLRLSGPAAPGAELLADRRSAIGGERPVGHLGSAVVSPALGPIGLALLRREAAVGDELAVGEEGVRGVVSELPFV